MSFAWSHKHVFNYDKNGVICHFEIFWVMYELRNYMYIGEGENVTFLRVYWNAIIKIQAAWHDIASNYAGKTKQNLPHQISHISFWKAFVPYCSQIPRSKNNRSTLAEDLKILHTYPTYWIRPLNRLSIWRRADSTRRSHYSQHCGRPTTWKRNWKGLGKKNWGKFYSCCEQMNQKRLILYSTISIFTVLILTPRCPTLCLS